MKAFLLAAGHGMRLRPITNTIPKCMVPIRGEPLLQIWLDLCASFGIDDVLINVNAHKEIICNFLESTPKSIRVTVSHEEVLLGSAGTLRAHRNWIGSDPLFWV